MNDFVPKAPLLEGHAVAECRAVVVVPARNEEVSLSATLDALHAQVDGTGEALPPGSFEVILLLNNCTDGSAEVARHWCSKHAVVNVHVCERSLVGDEAHVGMARSLLMDSAWQRLAGEARGTCGILTTDADTVPAPDWVFQNLEALRAGADVVGGSIMLDASALPDAARLGYERDREYQRLVAELEDRLDPQAGDPCPRHLEHFGGSLACTPAIYARVGGMPAVTPLEDVAFIDRLRHIDARIRHEPKVKVFTSARLTGRVEVGLSGQLRQWQAMADDRESHRVASAEYLQHRFRVLRGLRQIYAQTDERAANERTRGATQHLLDVRARVATCGEFLAEVDCNKLVDDSFRGERESGIAAAIEQLKDVLVQTALRVTREEPFL